MSLYLGENLISGVATPIEPTRNIGQIITSTIPLTDAGLHLLDGSLIQGDGVYDDFVQYMANLTNLYPQCFTDETTWQNTVNSKGACGKFVYDSTNNTVRLPKITGFIEGTVDSNALGELVEAGLPNITGILGNLASTSTSSAGATSSGALYWTHPTNYQNDQKGSGGTYGYDPAIDASRSSSIYGNSNTVQPQAIKVYYYVVLATTTKTDIEVDIDEVVTDLNSKADDNAVVHLANNETITGVKTFTSEVNFSAGNSLTKVIQQDDENFCIYKNDIPILASGTDVNAPILLAPANQTTQQYSIVTTQYISNLCVKFSNGLMIQWGNSGSGGTINFHQPFANDDVVVTATIKAANGTNDNDAITSINSVGFYFHNYSGGGCLWTAFGHWY